MDRLLGGGGGGDISHAKPCRWRVLDLDRVEYRVVEEVGETALEGIP